MTTRPPSAVRLLALVLALSLLASGCGAFGAGGYEIQAEFTRTYNLFPGSPVRILGLDVGRISHLDVEPGSDTVTVTMLIEDGAEIPVEATATIVPESLLGERYVQLAPPHSSGATLAPGDVIPVERTMVPLQFDQVLENLNQFVGGLQETEVGRLFSNLAEILEGNGAELGATIDSAAGAIGVLEENDDELVALASRLADLNETLATRDEEMGQLIEDWDTLTGSLVDDRDDIDAALSGLVRLTRNLEDVLRTHRGTLEEDIETLTQVGRTANRNLDQISLLILGSAELFRHAERIIDRQRNWLPLLDQVGELGETLADSLVSRLEGLCLAAGNSEEECESIPIADLIGEEICFPPLVTCSDPDDPDAAPTKSFAEAMRDLAAAEPELAAALVEDDPAPPDDETSNSGSQDDDAPDGGFGNDDAGDGAVLGTGGPR